MATILTKPTREYIDVDFNFIKHPISNNLVIKKGSNAVKQSIINLLMLKEGYKPFHPEIKSPIYGYLFENATVVLQVILESEIKKYLASYEPRAIIKSVSIEFPSPNTINCLIFGEIVNIQEPFSVSILVDRLR